MVVMFACAERERGIGESGPLHADYPVIGTLAFRNHTITIKTSSAGPIYSVQTKDGKWIARDVEEAEFQAKHPTVYEGLRSTHAGIPWAGL